MIPTLKRPRFRGRRTFAATARVVGEHVALVLQRGCWCRSTDGDEFRDERRSLLPNLGDELIVSAHDVTDYDAVAALEVVRAEPLAGRVLSGVVRDGKAWVQPGPTAVQIDRRRAKAQVAA